MTQRLHFFTIVKNGLPFISWHYPMLRSLPFDWTWHVIEGTAAAEHDTAWCKSIPPGLSDDGTSEYLDSLTYDHRVVLHRNSWWHGKIEMVNEALSSMFEPGLLWQLDSDEIWTREQIVAAVRLMDSRPDRNCAYFYCRYFVAPSIIITTRGTYGNRSEFEWLRLWRFEPGMRFASHEPPRLRDFKPVPFTHKETEAAGLVFDHFAYVTTAQVAFKERYYGYKDALSHWQLLQRNTSWPVMVKAYLPWVKDEAKATLI